MFILLGLFFSCLLILVIWQEFSAFRHVSIVKAICQDLNNNANNGDLSDSECDMGEGSRKAGPSISEPSDLFCSALFTPGRVH